MLEGFAARRVSFSLTQRKMHETARMFQRPVSRCGKSFKFSKFANSLLSYSQSITRDACRTPTLIYGLQAKPAKAVCGGKAPCPKVARSCRTKSLPVHIKKRSGNVAGVQAGVFSDVVNRSGPAARLGGRGLHPEATRLSWGELPVKRAGRDPRTRLARVSGRNRRRRSRKR